MSDSQLNKKKIFSDYLFNLVRTMLNVLIPMVTLPFVLNRIGAENYGIFNYTNSIVAYFSMAAVLGIPTYASREIARIRDIENLKQTVSEIFCLQFISVVLASLIFYLGFYPLFPEDQKTIFFILSIQIVGNIFNTEWFYIGRQKFKYIAVRSIIIKVLNVVAILLIIKAGDNSHSYAAILVCTGLATGLVNIRGVITYLSFRNIGIKKHLKPVFVLFALSVAGLINSNIDKTLTGILVGPLYVGYYSLGFRLTRILQQLFTAMNSIIFPRVTRVLADSNTDASDRLIRFSMNYISMFSWPILWGLMLYAEDIVILLFEPELLPAVPSLIILTGTVPVIAVLNVVRQQILLPRDKDKALIVLTVITTLSNIVFNLLLVPSYQHIGAAAATLVAEASGLIYGLIYSWRKFSTKLFSFGQLKYFAASLVLFPLHYFLKGLENSMDHVFAFIIQVVISILVYFIALFIIKDDFFYKYMKTSLEKVRDRNS